MVLERLTRIVLLVALLGSVVLMTGGSVLAECSQLDRWPSFTPAVPTAKPLSPSPSPSG